MVKDYAYAATFDKKDKPLMHKFVRQIKASMAHAFKNKICYHSIVSDQFFQVCEKIWNDHKTIALQVGNRQVSFDQLVKSEDLTVDAGHQQNIRLIEATSTNVWSNIGYGTGGSTYTGFASSALATEVLPRLTFAGPFGWNEYSQMSVRFAAIGGESLTTTTISEMGVFADATGGDMLNRNTFSNQPIARVAGRHPIILSSVIELAPIGVYRNG